MITLIQKSKITGKITNTLYYDFDELLVRLKQISAPYYVNTSYVVVSDTFNELKENFKTTFNPNYFTVDDDLEIITINKLKTGEKKFIKKKVEVLENEEDDLSYWEKTLKKLEDKYIGFLYEEEERKVVIEHNENVITIFFSKDNEEVEKVYIDGHTLDDIRRYNKGRKEAYKLRSLFNETFDKLKKEP